MWDGDKQSFTPKPINICETHNKKDWMKCDTYRYLNGSIECTVCGWGSLVPGYIKVYNGAVIDLRIQDKLFDK